MCLAEFNCKLMYIYIWWIYAAVCVSKSKYPSLKFDRATVIQQKGRSLSWFLLFSSSDDYMIKINEDLYIISRILTFSNKGNSPVMSRFVQLLLGSHYDYEFKFSFSGKYSFTSIEYFKNAPWFPLVEEGNVRLFTVAYILFCNCRKIISCGKRRVSFNLSEKCYRKHLFRWGKNFIWCSIIILLAHISLGSGVSCLFFFNNNWLK